MNLNLIARLAILLEIAQQDGEYRRAARCRKALRFVGAVA